MTNKIATKQKRKPAVPAKSKPVIGTDIGTASHLAKCLFRPLKRSIDGLNTSTASGRLQSELMKVLPTDKSNPAGSRNFAACRLSLLKRFEFNDTPALQPFYDKCKSGFDPVKKIGFIYIPTINPSCDIIAPPGATWYRIINNILHFDSSRYAYRINNNTHSGHYPLREKRGAMTFATTVQKAGEHLLMVTIGIKFYTVIGDQLTEHPDNDANSLIIHSITPC